MRSIELFSGAGGLAKGLELSGFEHVSFVECNKNACSTLKLNFNADLVFEGDIRDYQSLDLHEIDMVAGGPPCQPFSLGGKHKANEDSRDMFPFAIKTIENVKPKAFIFENVKGLLRESFSEYFSYILLRLTYPDFLIRPELGWKDNLQALKKINPLSYEGIKYDVHYKLLNAANYGIPQTRERVIIVGIRSDLHERWEFPVETHSQERLLWEQYVSGEYWERHKIKPPKDNKELGRALFKKFGAFPPCFLPWQTIRDALIGVPNPQGEHTIQDHIYKSGARAYQGHTGSDIDWPAKTIKAGAHGVPGGENMIRFSDGTVRYLTVYEAKILQTFPKNFVIHGAWGEAMRQIGNAVPVKLADIIGQKLYDTIYKKKLKSVA